MAFDPTTARLLDEPATPAAPSGFDPTTARPAPAAPATPAAPAGPSIFARAKTAALAKAANVGNALGQAADILTTPAPEPPPMPAAPAAPKFSEASAVPAPEPPPPGTGGMGSEFVQGLKAGAGGQNVSMLGGALEAGGVLAREALPGVGGAMESAGKAMQDWGTENTPTPQVGSISDVPGESFTNTLENLGKYAAFQAGSGIGTSLPGIVTGGVAALATANPAVGFIAGAVGPSYLQNLGDVYTSAKADPDITAAIQAGKVTQEQMARTAALAAVPIAALDAVGLEKVLGAAFQPAKDKLYKRILKGMATGAIAEGSTEGLQNVVSQWAQTTLGQNKALGDRVVEVVDNVLGGVFAGGLMGGASSVHKTPEAPSGATPNAPLTGEVLPPTIPPKLPAPDQPHVASAQRAIAAAAAGQLLPVQSIYGRANAGKTAEQPAAATSPAAGMPPVDVLSPTQPLPASRETLGTAQPAAELKQLPAPEAAAEQSLAADIAPAAHEAATSPQNALPEPTEAQKLAGNYKKGHVSFQGNDITIENPVGSTRTGTDPNGKPWSVDMSAHYGYVKRTTGADGDQVDVYLPDQPDANAPVHVFDQFNPETGEFDEHKAVLGVPTREEAERIYDAHFSDGSGAARRRAVTVMSADEFKAWSRAADALKPARDAAVAQGVTPEPAPAAPEASPAERRAEAERKAIDYIRWWRSHPGNETSSPSDLMSGIHGGTTHEVGSRGGLADRKHLYVGGSYGPNVQRFKIADLWDKAAPEPAGPTDIEPDTNRPEPAETAAESAPSTDKNADKLSDKATAEELFGDISPSDGDALWNEYGQDILRELATSRKSESAGSDQSNDLNKLPPPEQQDRPKGDANKVSTFDEVMFRKSILDAVVADRDVIEAASQPLSKFGPAFMDIAKGYIERRMANADPEQRAALVVLYDNGALNADVFTPDVIEAARARAKEIAGQANTDQDVGKKLAAAEEAMYSAMEKANLPDEEQRVAWMAGWNHAIAGGTRSNMPSTSNDAEATTMDAGYAAALAGGFAKTKGKKLEGVGAQLRRLHDMKTDKPGAKGDSGFIHETIQEILKLTTRASVFAPTPADDVTPGAARYLEKIRGAVKTFKQMADGDGTDASIYSHVIRGFYYRFDTDSIDNLLERDVTDEAMERLGDLRDKAEDYVKAVGGFLSKGLDGVRDVNDIDARLRAMLADKNEGLRGFLDFYLVHHLDLFTDTFKKDESTVYTNKNRKPLRRPRFDRVERNGLKDYRGGKNVTAEDLVKTFGFDGVTLGEWVSSKQRQDHMNYAYDALMDFAAHLGWKPKTMGFGGRLHLAFGALGSGRHSAHYQPQHPKGDGTSIPVINLTNTRGDGALAHEYFHAIDFMLREAQYDKKQHPAVARAVQALQYAPSTPQEIDAFVARFLNGPTKWQNVGRLTREGHARKAVEFILRNLNEFRTYGTIFTKHAPGVSSTRYYRDAQELDKGAGKNPYWSNKEELFARAAEAWMFDTLGGSNNYLVSDWVGDSVATKSQGYRGTPYPMGEERARINEVLNRFFRSIEQGGDGNIKAKDDADSLYADEISRLIEHVRKIEESLSPEQLKKAEEERLASARAEQRAAEEEREARARAAEEADQRERRRAQEERDRRLYEERLAAERALAEAKAAEAPAKAEDLSMEDWGALFDEALAEQEEAAQEKPEIPPQNERVSRTPAPRKKEPPVAEAEAADLARIGKEIAQHGFKAGSEALKGLYELFGGRSLRSFPGGMDDETYQKALPHFRAMWKEAKAAGKSIKEFLAVVAKVFGAGIRPYIMRFGYEEVTLGGQKATVQPPPQDNDHERDPLSDDGESPLAGVAARKDRSSEGGGSVSDRDEEGRGTGATDDTGSDADEGVSGARGGRGGASGRNTSRPGGRGGKGRAAGGAGRKGGRVSGLDATDDQSGRVAQPNIPATNFVITDEVRLGQGGEAEKFRDNIAAIEIIKTLDAERRRATPDEQRQIARYVGWGGLANAFADKDGNFKPDWETRGQQLADLLTPEELAAARASTRNAHYTSEAVVRGMWDALRHLGYRGGLALEPSMGTGNFVGMSPEDIASQFIGVEYDGVTSKIARALYPASTVLHSGFQYVPLSDGAFDLVIGNPPFGKESLNFQHKPELRGVSIHNQFFIASLDALKPNGVMAMVVSRYLMDAKDASARAALAERGELLGAIRLPDTAFKQNARTEVVTDIIFMRRRTAQEQADMAEALRQDGRASTTKSKKTDTEAREVNAVPIPRWLTTTDIADPLGGEPITVNAYFADNPDMIVGTMDRSGTMRQGGDVTVKLPKGEDLGAALAKRIARLPANVIEQDETAVERGIARHKQMSESLEIALSGNEAGAISRNATGDLEQVVERETPEGNYELSRRTLTQNSPWSSSLFMNADGKWYREVQALDEKGEPLKKGRLNVYKRHVFENESEIPVSQRLGGLGFKRLGRMVDLRDLLKSQLILETQDAPSKIIEANRKKLAAAYAEFVKAYGPISADRNGKFVSEMPDGALVLALETKYRKEQREWTGQYKGSSKVYKTTAPEEATPAAILKERVLRPYEPPTSAASPADAIFISLSETGALDIARVAELLGTTEAGVVHDLHDSMDEPLIFKNPDSGRWETRDTYLTGQVKRKLKAAQAAEMAKNVEALSKVQPARIGAENINVILGASWPPTSVYEAFVKHITGAPAVVRRSALTNSYDVEGDATGMKARDWGTDRVTAVGLIDDALNNRQTKVMDRDREGKSHLNQEQTDLANLKREQIATEFADWVFSDGDRRALLVDIFNEKFNTRVTRQYDGTHLTLPGKVPDTVITMRRHQKNAIWRGIAERFMLIDHAVGAGKTFTAIAMVMERRRMGLSRKPMIVVPNHMVEQFAADTYRLYPGAKVLAAGKNEFDRKNRRKLFAKIATGDWDVVIVPHSSFGFIGIAPETEERYIRAEATAAQAAIDEAWDQAADEGLDTSARESGKGRKPFNVKEAERVLATLEARMESIANRPRDRLLTFEQMGVDHLVVDEAHEFKNLFYNSRTSGVRGMGNKSGSQKAFDLYTKVRTLQESPRGAVTFMSGTPISNSAVEMYTMMRYLAADDIADLGFDHFDAFRAQYVSISTKYEPTESGSLKEVNRLGRNWSNMRSLMDLYYSFTDAVTNDDIKRMYAEDNPGRVFPLPKVKGGGRQSVVVQPTPAQTVMLKNTIEGFEGLSGIGDPYERNKARLRLMDQARKLSLDVRAVNPAFDSEEAGGKLDVVADKAVEIYNKWTPDRGTQLIFLDRSVPASKGDGKLIKEYDALVVERERAIADGNEEALRRAEDKLEKYDGNEMSALKDAARGGWTAYAQLKRNLVARGIPENEIRFVQEANNDEQKKALFDSVNDGEVRILIGSTPRMGAGTNVQKRLVGLHHVDVTWKPSDIEQREGRIIRQENSLYDKYGPDDFEVEINAYVTERTVDAKMWDLNATKLKMINGIRNYDGSFNMEFEEDDSVSMAEIAALATGDPLMLERITLMGAINKLGLLENQHRRKEWALRDEIDRAEKSIKTLPARIELAQADAGFIAKALEEWDASIAKRSVTVDGNTFGAGQLAKAMQAALEARERQQAGDTNARVSVEIDGEKLTSKDAMEKAIEAALGDPNFEATINGKHEIRALSAGKFLADKANTLTAGLAKGDSSPAEAVGKMLGLTLEMEVSRGSLFGHPTVSLAAVTPEGRTVVSVDADTETLFGNVAVANMLRRLRDSIAAIPKSDVPGYLQDQLDRAKRDLPELQAKAGKPFDKSGELEAKRARLEEVTRELAAKSAKTLALDGPGEGKFAARARFQPDVNDDPVTSALKVMAQSDNLFQYPVSTKKTVKGIVRDVAPDWTVREEDGMHIISTDDSWAWLIEPGDGTVHVNVGALFSGSGGSAIYHIAANYAYNNGLVFTGDPLGLTKAAIVRRTENLLSSALKFGTTRHIRPADEQNLPWREGDDNLNLRTLVRASMRNMDEQYPGLKGLRYNFDTHKVVDENGNPVSADDFDRFTEASASRDARAGRATITRAALYHTLLSPDGRAAWDGLLARIGGQPGQFGVEGDLARRFYAATTAQARPSAGLSASGLRDFLASKVGGQALRNLLRTGTLHIASSADTNIPVGAKTAIRNGELVYGFYDEATDSTWLFHDNLTDGESRGDLENAYGIFMHEMGVHYGMPGFLGEPLFTKVLKELRLAAKANKTAYGKAARAAYAQVPKWTRADHQDEEALAWLVTDRANHSLSFVKRIIAKLRAFLVRMGFTRLVTADALVELARGAVRHASHEHVNSRTVGEPAAMFAARRAEPVEDSPELDDSLVARARQRFEPWLDAFRYEAQDRFHYLKKAQKEAAAARGLPELPEDEDAYLAELRYHGMAGAAIEDFQRDHVDPMLKAIKDAGLDIERVDDFLHARHAPEANRQLQKINPTEEELADRIAEAQEAGDMVLASRLMNHKGYEGDNTALSGMSNAEARGIIDAARADGTYDALEAIGERIDAITEARRQLLVSSGLETRDTVAAWEATYQHYVPLKREGKGDALPRRGRGYDTRGKEKRRAGSNRAVEHILANVVAQHEATLMRAEKAKVGRAMLDFARNNANPDLYEVNRIEYQPSFDAQGLVTYRADPGFIMADNVFVVRENGRDHRITFNDANPDAMKIVGALKNLGAEESGAIVNVLTKMTRILSLVNTGANPEFIISNFARDLQTAGYNLSGTEADKLKWRIIGDVGKAWAGIRSFQKGKGGAWADRFDAFRKAGAQTGWMEHYRDITDRERALTAKVRDMEGGKFNTIKRGLRAMEKFIEDENAAVENAIRLSAFVHAREAGLSEAKAARLAKELTVNFNRRGNMGKTLNALYLFYNASIQGQVRIVQAIAKSRKVQGLVLATVVGAALLDMWNRAVGDDDDDDKPNPYDTEAMRKVKDRNLVFMLPGGDYIKIPLPWGYNVFHVMGQSLGEMLTKPGAKATDAAARIAGATVDAFNPIGGSASPLQFISPTVVDPIAQWYENKDWAGRPLRPTGNPFGPPQPESQRYWSSVRPYSKWITEHLNTLTGGDQVRPGAIDVSPEAIDLAIDTITGGAGRFLADSVGAPWKKLQGEDLETYEVPLLRKVYGSPGAAQSTQDYYKHRDEVALTMAQFKHYATDGAKQAEIRKDYGPQMRMIPALKSAEAQLKGLRDAKKRVEGREAQRRIEERMRAVMDRFNDTYFKVVTRAGD